MDGKLGSLAARCAGCAGSRRNRWRLERALLAGCASRANAGPRGSRGRLACCVAVRPLEGGLGRAPPCALGSEPSFCASAQDARARAQPCQPNGRPESHCGFQRKEFDESRCAWHQAWRPESANPYHGRRRGDGEDMRGRRGSESTPGAEDPSVLGAVMGARSRLGVRRNREPPSSVLEGLEPVPPTASIPSTSASSLESPLAFPHAKRTVQSEIPTIVLV